MFSVCVNAYQEILKGLKNHICQDLLMAWLPRASRTEMGKELRTEVQRKRKYAGYVSMATTHVYFLFIRNYM